MYMIPNIDFTPKNKINKTQLSNNEYSFSMASISSTMLEVIDITKVGQYILRFVLWLNIYEHTSLSNNK